MNAANSFTDSQLGNMSSQKKLIPAKDKVVNSKKVHRKRQGEQLQGILFRGDFLLLFKKIYIYIFCNKNLGKNKTL